MECPLEAIPGLELFMEMYLGFMDLCGTAHAKCHISSAILWGIKWSCLIIDPS